MTHNTRPLNETLSNPPIRLKDLSAVHLQDWGIRDFWLYNAEAEDPSFTCINSSEEEKTVLHKKGGQTLIICPTHDIKANILPDRWTGLINAFVDVRWFFHKNHKCTPIFFDGHNNNPWRNDDLLFQFPYFQHINHQGPCKDSFEVGESWCFNDCSRQGSVSGELDFKARITTAFSFKRKPRVADEASKPTKLCFVKKSVTVCVLPDFPDENKRLRPSEQPRTGLRGWTALFIAPKEIITDHAGKNVDDAFLDTDILHGNASEDSYLSRKPVEWQVCPANRNADFIQTFLIEVGFRKISSLWNDNMVAVDDACRDFHNKVLAKVHSNTDRSLYWRRGVDEDLLNAYKLQKRLETLQKNLHNVVDGKQGIWPSFRKARPRVRMGKLETKRDKTEEETAEYYKLRFLLFYCADRYADRLSGNIARIEEKLEELRALRELLVELSQTKASLYANDLGDNVMYLTYFSILFLPLGFCTSLWSMNHELPFDAFVPTICTISVATVVFLAYLIRNM
ncbi:hypothetical protein SLS56_008395 [Neofusicoccum ribis]|uniref:Uncharacterized protein n=1 Tax=Neofusicoccum ribis TaxID=45134 RepID=A0ABR3SL14_9PEZI